MQKMLLKRWFVRITGGLWIGLLIVLVGCAPASTPGAPALGPDVSVDEVLALVEAGDVTVIDVREDEEFAEGHIAAATSLPLDELPDRVSEVPTDRPVVLVCRSGNSSSRIYSFLEAKGFTNIHNMTGGMLAWQKAGYAVEK